MNATPTDVEAAIIRDLVADHAADYYGGPLGFGASDAARYVTEAHVAKAIPRLPWREVWTLVAQHIAEHPEVLTTSKAQREARTAARNAEADQRIDDAFVPFKAGRLDDAVALIDRAELVAPLHRPHGRRYDEYRTFILGG